MGDYVVTQVSACDLRPGDRIVVLQHGFLAEVTDIFIRREMVVRYRVRAPGGGEITGTTILPRRSRIAVVRPDAPAKAERRGELPTGDVEGLRRGIERHAAMLPPTALAATARGPRRTLTCRSCSPGQPRRGGSKTR
ncbi:MAG: hypothetical protein RL325_728 [Planctomycetota bacterium]